MHVVCTARPTFGSQPSLAVQPHRGRAPSLLESDDALTAAAGRLSVCIDKATGAFTWLDENGALLVREPQDGTESRILDEIDVVLTRFDTAARRTERAGVDGTRVTVEGGRRVVDRRAYATTMRLQFAPDEAIYGLGQHEEGILNYRRHSQDLYQQNMKVAVPVIVSTRGYAIVWDSYSPARFEDGPRGAIFSTAVDDELDFYVVLGPEFDAIMAGIRLLTGHVPMLPRWALGYVQSKERYCSQAELLDTVAEFRRRGIPLDCIVQDWHTWSDGQWGQKSFDPERYPAPDALCESLHSAGVRLMVSIWPNMHGDGPNQLQLRERGLLLGDDSTYDARRPEARALYWAQSAEGYFRHGVDAWWADCAEPFEADWNGAVKPEPSRRRGINVSEHEKYLDPEFANAYSLLHTRGLYEGQRTTDERKRVVILTRSASLGQQRYGALTWSGDISATWQTLRRQIADGLNFCLTGNPRWTFDIGAFFVGRRADLWFCDGDFPGGVEDFGYRELYVRWLQLGTFLPMMRSHGTETPREPWRFGKPGESWYDTILAFIRLRYRLVPYLYSLHARETRDDYTSFRALAFDFRHDRAVHDITDQFMLGPALLVCPVTEAMHFGSGSSPIRDAEQVRRAYLPRGADWHDFWTGARYRGGQVVTAAAPVDRLPIFVRAGSILPLGPPAEHTGAAAGGPLELRVYPGADGAFDLYDDSGDGYGYEAGECAITELRWDDGAARLRIGARTGTYPGMPTTVPARVVVVGSGQGVGPAVATDGTWVEIGDAPTERAEERRQT